MLVLAALIVPLLFPSILMLTFMAAASFLLVVLAVWDDASQSGG